MSTLKVINLQHPSSGTVNAALTSGGLLTGAGMDLITTSTFSATSAINISNCFSSTYENYQIVISGTGSVNNNPAIRMRTGGVTDSAANYDFQYVSANAASVTSGRSTAQTSATLGDWNTTLSATTVDIYGPFASGITGWHTSTFSPTSGALLQHYVGRHATAASQDGFTIIPLTGTLTGTVRVYGLRNS